MIGDGPCHLFGEIGVISVKGQKRPHRPEEVFNVFGLGLLTASGVGFLFLGESLGGALGFEIGTNALNGRRCCSNAPGENLPAFLLGDDPMISGSLHPASQGGVTRRQEHPAIGDRQDFAIGAADGVRRRAGGEGVGAHYSSASLRS